MEDTKRVIVTGATGLIGSRLCSELQRRGYAVVVFSRDPETARRGESIYTFGKRQTQASVRAETQNRVRGIGGLVRAMAEAQVKPQVFVSASSVGTYGYADFTDAEFTENSPPGTDFWGQDSLPWEEAALEAERLGIRTVVMRTGYVLDAQPQGGLAQQVAQFRRGFGGPVLPGTQWLPWIHVADEVGLVVLALEDARVHGPLNGTAPGVVRNQEFAQTLGQVVGKPARLPTPGVLLRMGFGVVAETIIHGRRVVPRKALDLAYQFQFATLESALRDLVGSESNMIRE